MCSITQMRETIKISESDGKGNKVFPALSYQVYRVYEVSTTTAITAKCEWLEKMNTLHAFVGRRDFSITAGSSFAVPLFNNENL